MWVLPCAIACPACMPKIALPSISLPVWNAAARVSVFDGCIFMCSEGVEKMKKVAVIMGSDSDLPVLEGCFKTLKKLDIPYEAHVYSAHRTPFEAAAFAKSARENGFGVIIAAAGKAAHLAGALAAQSILPVIGIPVKASALDGLDALLSTVQMPGGIPVATVAINGSENAALLAAQMIALSDDALAQKLLNMREEMHQSVLEKDANLNV